MFSKKDKKSLKWSITNKLTFLYTISTITLFIIFALFLYWISLKAIDTAEIQYIVDEVNVIQALFKQHNGNLTYLNQEVDGVPAALKNASYHYFVELFDEHERQVMMTPEMHKELPNAIFPAVDKEHWTTQINYWTSPAKKKFILMSAPIAFDKSGHIILAAHLALDGTYQKNLFRAYLDSLLLFLIALVVGVIIIGRLIAYRGLRELYEFTKLTEKISVANLAARINLTRSPKELIPLGQAYNSMLSRLEDAFKRLSQCAAELAHELRVPLHNLRGETEIALTQARTLAQYRELLESNMEEYQRLSQLVENILFLAKAENPHNIMHFTEINAGTEIAKIVEFFNILATQKNISLNYIGAAVLKVEPILFQRALYNILANALRYTPTDGVVTIKIINEINYVIIVVTDNGCGIPEDALPYIFDWFYRVNSRQAPATSGSGLGLAIVKSIMELHQGKVTIESQLGKGTSVKLFFSKCLEK